MPFNIKIHLQEHMFVYNRIPGGVFVGNRIIMHIDVNSAYLSWEAVWRLQHGGEIDLREIPSVIEAMKKAVTVLCWPSPFLQKIEYKQVRFCGRPEVNVLTLRLYTRIMSCICSALKLLWSC